MKSLFLKSALILVFLSPTSWAAGDRAGGGGGKKEPLFKEIAANISSWIQSGNADQIESKLPSDVTLQEYKSGMLQVLGNYNVMFTDDKVVVGNHEKTCRSYVDAKRVNQIICNNTQFGLDTPDNINEIYRQVHHEFAGLACRKRSQDVVCLEQNRNDLSDYRISNHISAFIGPETIMRLPVKPNSSFGNTYKCSGILSTSSGEKSCGELTVAPDMKNLQVASDGSRQVVYWLYFPNCADAGLVGMFSEQRRLHIAVFKGNGKPNSFPHVSELTTSSTIDRFETGGRASEEDFLSVTCVQQK
jgi:hypothetical protein